MRVKKKGTHFGIAHRSRKRTKKSVEKDVSYVAKPKPVPAGAVVRDLVFLVSERERLGVDFQIG